MLRWLSPRSLSARMVLITLGTIVLVQAATFATVSYYRKQFTENVTVDYAATTIRTLRAALAQIPSGDRARFVRDASEGAWHLWSRTLPPEARLEHRHGMPAPANRRLLAERREPPSGDVRNSLRGFVDALNQKLDEDARVALSRGPEPRLYISLISTEASPDAPEYREWLVVPLDKITPPVSTALIAIWLAGMVSLLVLAALFAWHITRPLTRLARAADQLAKGAPERVEPSGPMETRLLAERFNAMLDTLAESTAVQRTLLAGLPHDLKGPLSRMWLRIEMLEDVSVKDGMLKDVQDMQRMVNQFIGFVRGADPQSYQFAPLDIDEWLEEQVAAWESAGSDVHLRTHPNHPVLIHADRLALGRLLDNLVGNALNHGKPPIDIGLTLEGSVAVLAIADHGTGIPAERRSEALRPFSRLDQARTKTGSVGLGLALADIIARAHKGQLQLGDTPGGGLTVRIRFPLEQAGSTDTESPTIDVR
jgi:two-component system osmolarity sensor histidine kinase EnvZ